jgi:predicted nucleotidyltransferase component of viral defense system
LNNNPENFKALVARAMHDPDYAGMQPVIEKELLHYDILFCLKEQGFLRNLTFQGGTALRLCYGSNRLSEDLDFAGGFDFNSSTVVDMKECLETYIGHRYALDVSVKDPESLRQGVRQNCINVDKWQISIITSPERRDLPKQKIKIEVANSPSYTKDAVLLRSNYDFLPDGYSSILVPTESMDEILADKLLSLPATTSHVRFRDIWDISWLQQRGAETNVELINNKVRDYGLHDYEENVAQLIEKLSTIVQGESFKNEMKRFLPQDVYQRTMGQPAFTQYLENTLSKAFQQVLQEIDAPSQGPSFSM